MKSKLFFSSFLCATLLINGCATPNDTDSYISGSSSTDIPYVETLTADMLAFIYLEDEAVPVAGSLRDNSSLCLVPIANGLKVYANSVASIDSSNASEGYICVSYFGTCPKVKLQITKGSGTTYTYNLTAQKGYEVFPLSDGSGTYTVAVYENVYDNQYANALSQNIDVSITNEFGPNLYPNQYVNFNSSNQVVLEAANLVSKCKSDLEVIATIYNYVATHISYDYDKISKVQSGYTSDVDATLKSGTGICLDYASVMCAMLRSQRVPTRLEVGYAGTAYHAWISTYISEIGWVNGMIQFDGKTWKIMDPTFASTTDSKTLKSFLSNADNYQTKYIY